MSRDQAFGGAFLQPESMLLVIQEAALTGSTQAFDSRGHVIPVSYYRKFSLDTVMEYGVIDWLTVTGRFEHVSILAEGPPSGTYRGPGMSELGARVLIHQFDDTLVSAQASFRLPGTRASDNPATVDLTAREVDMRLMGGGSFFVDDRPGFWSAEAGFRRRGGGYPDEWHVDLGTGVFMFERLQLIAQAFTTLVSASAPAAPKSRSHKLQASLVFNPGRIWSLQAGAFFTPLAMEARRDSGIMLAFWRRY